MKFCAKNAWNIKAIRNFLIYYIYYHNVLEIIGTTKDKNPSFYRN